MIGRRHISSGCARTHVERTARAGHAFTLIEVLVTVAIISLTLGMVSVAFQKLSDASALTTAVNTLTTYAAAARSYAVDNNIETMLVVNPYNGRLEIWYLNPPPDGRPWSPMSNPEPDGYRFAPVLDSSVALPTDIHGKPLVVVHPVDFDAKVDGAGTPLRSANEGQANRDNLNWVAICFDSTGRLVTRMRRIATRMPTDYTGAVVANANRREDGTPDVGRTNPPFPSNYQVDPADSLITSAPGFIVADRMVFEHELPNVQADQTPNNLVNIWLPRTRPGGKFGQFARQIVVNPNSGRELVTVE